MKIVLDMDQILCQWTERVLEWWNEDKGTCLTLNDITDWDVGPSLGEGGGDFIRSVMRWPEFYTRLQPVPGAVKGTQKLMEMGHEVVIASAVPVSAGIAYHGKCQWLRDYMPFFPLENFFAMKRKEWLEGQVLFDDGLHNILPWLEKGRVGVLMDAPWNRARAHLGEPTQRVENVYSGRRQLVVVNHWNQFLEVIRQIDADEAKAEAEEVSRLESDALYCPHKLAWFKCPACVEEDREKMAAENQTGATLKSFC